MCMTLQGEARCWRTSFGVRNSWVGTHLEQPATAEATPTTPDHAHPDSVADGGSRCDDRLAASGGPRCPTTRPPTRSTAATSSCARCPSARRCPYDEDGNSRTVDGLAIFSAIFHFFLRFFIFFRDFFIFFRDFLGAGARLGPDFAPLSLQTLILIASGLVLEGVQTPRILKKPWFSLGFSRFFAFPLFRLCWLSGFIF